MRILMEVWWVMAEAAPWILGGTVLAGLLKTFLDPSRLRHWLARAEWQSVVRATFVGVPLPLCSCSVLPVAMELRRAGASRGATGSFLVSTPQSGADSILLTIGMMNPLFAGVRLFAAFVTGMVTGLALNLLDRSGAEGGGPAGMPGTAASPCGKDQCGCAEAARPSPAPRPGLLGGQRYAFGDLFPSMAPYYVVGFLATGLVLALLPADFLAHWLGGGLAGMLAVSVVGLGVYLCASAATPLAAGLMAKGMSPGTALVLLLAGPATSLASMLLVRAMIGTRGLAVYLASILVTAIGAGLLLDFVAGAFGFAAIVSRALGEEEAIGPMGHLLAAVLLLLLVPPTMKALWRRLARPGGQPAATLGG